MSLFTRGRRGVLETDDFRRILALPRRKSFDAGTFVRQLTDVLSVKGKCEGDKLAPVQGLCPVCAQPRELRPIQAQALYEIGTHRGLFGPIRVGGGKTLISLLTPFVLGARRPILLLPASLREKAERERIRLAKHWRVARDLRIISYEELGREKAADLLTFYRPDLIIADEAHRLKTRKAGCTRRVIRYMREKPETIFVAISGTMIKTGIGDFAHILRWSHRDGAPVPLHDGELDEWSEVLDESANPYRRVTPGALLQLATEPEDIHPDDETKTARCGFHRRLVETPGVVATSSEQVDCSLYIRGLEFTPSATTDENFKTLRSKWETPDGWTLSMAIEVWATARQLALGFHYVLDPRPPGGREGTWLRARSAWAKFVRDRISRSHTLDTEKQIARACEKGELPDLYWREWQKVKDTFTPNQKAIWHDTSALEACEKWLKGGTGIVWVSHTFFGEELERRTGLPYFRQGGNDSMGRNLEDVSNAIKAGAMKVMPIIASAQACGTGYNLQPWNRNLVMSCLTGSDAWEQLIGRTHRDGQAADQVEVDILISCIEHTDAWERALLRARMTEDTMGQPQKILMADVDGFPAGVEDRPGARWQKQVDACEEDDESEDEV